MSIYFRNAFLLWLILLFLIGFLLQFGFGLPFVYAWLASANITTFFIMMIDKIQAHVRGRRTPEVVFYLMTLFGGSLGMLAGMSFFHHKTRKVSFQFFVGCMILIQVGLLAWYLNTDPSLFHLPKGGLSL